MSHGTRGEQALSTLKTLHNAKSSAGSAQPTSIFDLFDQVLGAKTDTTKLQGAATVAAAKQTDASAGGVLVKAARGDLSA